jgi:DNA-binding PadR family transcriptional regulator
MVGGMDDELTPTARTILGFLSLHPRSGYEIREAAKRSVSFFWGVSDGQLYPQLKVLADRGLIAARPSATTEPRARQVWELTDAGRQAFLDWLRAPSAALRTRDENLVKILFAAQLDPAEAVRLIGERRQQFEWFREQLGTVVPRATWREGERETAVPTPDLVRDYGLGFAATAIDWCDQAEAALRRQQS